MIESESERNRDSNILIMACSPSLGWSLLCMLCILGPMERGIPIDLSCIIQKCKTSEMYGNFKV